MTLVPDVQINSRPLQTCFAYQSYKSSSESYKRIDIWYRCCKSAVSLWLPLWPEKAPGTPFSTETGSSCYFLFVLVFYLSKRSRDFLWRPGGGRKKIKTELLFHYNTKHKRMKKMANSCLFFFSSGNRFLFSSFEEVLKKLWSWVPLFYLGP